MENIKRKRRLFHDFYCTSGCLDHPFWQDLIDETCRTDAYDSDGGLAYSIKGTCTDYTGCSSGSCTSTGYTDSCIDAYTVKEYYVSGSGCAYTTTNCVNSGYAGCYNGRCYYGGGGPMFYKV
jgi:hypothetical protein